MTEVLNNVNLTKVYTTIENGKKDRVFAKPIKLEGEWNFDTKRVLV